ncbi:prepilin peptidase [uncultured Sphingomonas sp.]|uniref:A24 family peptidase n=1 Tax=uncultured Sphingomonas sp. TaxID=158754 RepID=UPI0026182002|nr:prepilin peptidase [uncultured Sphingomonas sp.]
MGWDLPRIALMALLGLLLLAAGIQDARTREIANGKNAAIALLAPFWWWACGLSVWPDMVAQLAIGLGLFIVFALAFRLGMMGGGDVKMIAALGLWLPVQPLMRMLVVMALAGGVVTLLMLIEHRWLSARDPDGPVEVPYGVAIAIAGLLTLSEPIFNQFPPT